MNKHETLKAKERSSSDEVLNRIKSVSTVEEDQQLEYLEVKAKNELLDNSMSEKIRQALIPSPLSQRPSVSVAKKQSLITLPKIPSRSKMQTSQSYKIMNNLTGRSQIKNIILNAYLVQN